MPFRQNKSFDGLIFHGTNAPQLTFNITDLWYYNRSTPFSEQIPFGINESIVAEKLCRGGQIKVNITIKYTAFFNISEMIRL